MDSPCPVVLTAPTWSSAYLWERKEETRDQEMGMAEMEKMEGMAGIAGIARSVNDESIMLERRLEAEIVCVLPGRAPSC